MVIQRRGFLGISVSEWVAMVSIVATVIAATAGLSSKLSATETTVASHDQRIFKCETKAEIITTDVSEIKGDVKAVNAKIDILLNRK